MKKQCHKKSLYKDFYPYNLCFPQEKNGENSDIKIEFTSYKCVI